MGLVKVGATYLTSDTGGLTVTGIDDNSDYIFVYGVAPTNNGDNGRLRFMITGSGQDSTASYQRALIRFADGSNSGTGSRGYSYVEMEDQNSTNILCGGVIYLHNFFSGSQYSQIQIRQAQMGNTSVLLGMAGVSILERAISHNGLTYYYPVGQVKAGSYGVLYKVV